MKRFTLSPMADKRDGETKQIIAEAEELVGTRAAGSGGAKSTRELVDSAERLIQRDVEPPKLSPVPLIIIVVLVIAVAILGVYSAFGSAI